MSEFERVRGILLLVNVEVKNDKLSNQPHTFLKEQAKIVGLYRDSENADTSQWFSVAWALSEGSSKKQYLSLLESFLSKQSFLVQQSFMTIADVAVFYSVSLPKVAEDCLQFPSLCRWIRQMSDAMGVTFSFPLPFAPTIFGLPVVSIPVVSSFVQEEKKVPCEESKSSDQDKQQRPQMNEKQLAKQKEKAAKKDKKAQDEVPLTKPEEGGDNSSSTDLSDPSKLDLRVGVVNRCWPHPEAEKLLCEEIDMGGGEVRQIASGIKEFYSPEEVQGRKVIVLCNLKDRNLVGFKSQGMVICSSNSDHSVVKLLEPPATASPGDHVSFPGFGLEEELAGGKRREPATAAQVAKKKIFEKLSTDLRTDGNGVAMWGTAKFTIGLHGTVGSALPNGLVA